MRPSIIVSNTLALLLCGLVSLSNAAALRFLPRMPQLFSRLDRRAGTTDPKVGGWCTFHLQYTVSDFLGRSG